MDPHNQNPAGGDRPAGTDNGGKAEREACAGGVRPESLYSAPMPLPPLGPEYAIRKKSKFLAGLLSFFIPGTGHLYLGLMQKGLTVMLLICLDIVAVVYYVQSFKQVSVPLVLLLALLMPVIYFYSIFDVLQSADEVNDRLRYPFERPAAAGPARQWSGVNGGLVLIVAGVLLFLIGGKPVWLEGLLRLLGSYLGAVLLIGAGLLLFIRQTRK